MNINTKMTALADGVRRLSGKTEKMGIDAMTTNVSEANTEIDSQSDLIAQIATALEGKASGGSTKQTVAISVTTLNAAVIYYIDANGQKQSPMSNQSMTIEAWGGVITVYYANIVNPSGEYVLLSSYGGAYTYVFLADGGAVYADNGGGGN